MTASRYDAVIFDLDGTLLDTLDELAINTNTVLENNGVPAHPLSAYRYFVGEGAEILIKNALGDKSSDPDLVKKCLSEFLVIYRNTCGQNSRLYNGIPQLLDALLKEGLKLAVLSNKPHDLTVRNIDLFLNHIPFDLVLGQREGVPKKPDPQGACEIADHMGIDPDRFLYLGDTSIDMKTAVSAGMNPVGVLWGFRGIEELKEGGAVHIIEKPGDLMDLL